MEIDEKIKKINKRVFDQDKDKCVNGIDGVRNNGNNEIPGVKNNKNFTTVTTEFRSPKTNNIGHQMGNRNLTRINLHENGASSTTTEY